MSKKQKPQIPVDQLIRRLRLMGTSGGMLTRDRLDVVLQAADRLEELDERVAIMTETAEIPAIYPIPLPEVTRYES